MCADTHRCEGTPCVLHCARPCATCGDCQLSGEAAIVCTQLVDFIDGCCQVITSLAHRARERIDEPGQ